MIGIFDSGVGGLCSLKEYRRLIPRESIVYLGDRKNAPYGTKSKKEVIDLAKRNVRVLREMGAERILRACCTASSVYRYLNADEKAIVFPIIAPAALEAARIGNRITVISTEHTASSHVFKEEIRRISSDADVTELAAQQLVAMVERGARDGNLTEDEGKLLDSLATRIIALSPKALILGCTHFSHLEGEIAKRVYPTVIVNAAKLGARALANERRSVISERRGRLTFM